MEVAVAGPLRRALESLPAPDVTVGVRPEHISVVREADGQLSSSVVHVESLGHESLVRVDAHGVPLMLRIPGMPELGKGATLRLRLDALHFFDGEGVAMPGA